MSRSSFGQLGLALRCFLVVRFCGGFDFVGFAAVVVLGFRWIRIPFQFCVPTLRRNLERYCFLDFRFGCCHYHHIGFGCDFVVGFVVVAAAAGSGGHFVVDFVALVVAGHRRLVGYCYCCCLRLSHFQIQGFFGTTIVVVPAFVVAVAAFGVKIGFVVHVVAVDHTARTCTALCIDRKQFSHPVVVWIVARLAAVDVKFELDIVRWSRTEPSELS